MLERAVEIVPGVYWVGAVDRERTVFDSFMSLPYGTTYNSYLIKGKGGTALVDTVSPDFADTLLKKVLEVVPPETLDYVVMNHAEPDHAGTLPKLLSMAKKAQLVTTKKGLGMAKVFYDIPEERVKVVAGGDILSLGDKTLRFIDAPWLHWPETMFTYCVEDRVLFSCDFFGAHVASERLYEDEVGDVVLAEAKRYYAEIMMIFLNPVRKALERLEGLDIRIIAPSHGPVWRNPDKILQAHRGWAIGPLRPRVVVIYVSMYGSTTELEKAIVAAIQEEGVEAVAYNMLSADVSHIVQELVDSSAIVFGSPAFYGGVHPRLASSIELIRTMKPRGKMVAVFGSYGWAGGAVKEIKARLQPAGFDIVDSLEVQGPPREEDLKKASTLGRNIAKKVKSASGGLAREF
ncbi:MAG TPA: FprA family A-type flavoprotein [Candidatus Tripitaka californicus]|uniref:FprA family A-type flavoprotein n=1 Tax=Candidatus Tripitaka californicus TaxID=3367616 RepID=UPI0040296C1F|nr:FprA family A-type flavoprotein [Planctomycetota bacterium]